MNIALKPLLKKVQPITDFLKRDSVIIFALVVAAIFGFLVWRIGVLAGAEPTQIELNEKLMTVVRPRIDQDGIKKLEELQAQNINIQSYFSDRNNPFQE